MSGSYGKMRVSRSPSRRRDVARRRGATAVEFAMVAPILFVFIFALIEFGRIVMVQHTVVNAAREGCRIASLPTTTSVSTVDTAVRNYLQSTITTAADPNVVTVNVTSLSGITSGTPITVETQVSFSDVSWIPSG
ncbi:MAG: pilus assembly protein, partial [Chloroflexi bacterium]|nr:pilus assembly protein [Chloroflexota bacterium]